MIRDLRRSHYQQLTLSLLGAAMVGWVFGRPWAFLALSSIGYLIWISYQQHRLIAWLISGARKTPPEAVGLWGVIFDHLYRVQRDHRKQVSNYREVVQRMRSSTEALADGIMLLDAQGNIQWWNSAARDLLRLRKEDSGQLLINLLREPRFIKFYHKNMHREPITLENPARLNCHIQVMMTVFGKGERLLVLRDVTRLQQLEMMRQDFVANASHELKTPLTVFKGHLENILTLADNLPPPVTKALLSMSNQTQRMNNLVSDLLMLTRLDAATSSTEGQAIDVGQMLTQIQIDALELSGAQQHLITIDCQTRCQLLGSPGEIRSVLNNLVFNAVNYSPPGSKIDICWKTTSKGAVLSVADQGRGIEQHHIPRLTERFYRVDPGRSSAVGGTGLGLAIVKHALQHHDARLDISSQSNRGSVFSCIFPEERLIDPSLDESDEALIEDNSAPLADPAKTGRPGAPFEAAQNDKQRGLDRA
ncbi:phosphate regulon sensor histidine kinase PhoR [Reinekea sp.]|jgi:two-component system phosphate regulon sensor histidine kinase PhoR|uniref:phosphate regulon sensor histidine kinase PhoR n=1 Tax=Reinekea sp. TaxID=1970455 RepID=UPI002A83278E|nr:phosphate regulon sensor histidine kinase PhoR [Reinekea sp.]